MDIAQHAIGYLEQLFFTIILITVINIHIKFIVITLISVASPCVFSRGFSFAEI